MSNNSQHPRNNKALKIDFTDARTQGVVFTRTQGVFLSQGHRASSYHKDTGRLLITRTQGVFLSQGHRASSYHKDTGSLLITRTQGIFLSQGHRESSYHKDTGSLITRTQGVLSQGHRESSSLSSVNHRPTLSHQLWLSLLMNS